MRFVLTALLVIHGVIHLVGVVRAGKLADSLQGLGLLWLLTCLLFLASATALLARSALWWPLSVTAVVLSQALIVSAWGDAKAGTLVNLLLSIPILLAAADGRFSARTEAVVHGLLERPWRGSGDVVRAEELEGLPEPVALWLRHAGVVGRPRALAVHLTQTGALRTAADGPWMPARAEQHFRIDEPGFVWQVHTRMHGLPVVGRDSYLDGHGHMLITLGGLIPVVNARDARIDQGTLLRFLGEMVWFPAAALRDYIRWEAIDDRSAKATMQYAGVSGSAVFSFDAEHRVAQVSARRYLGSGAAARLEHWMIPITDWATFAGILVPSRGDVVWRLSAGDFDYFRWQVTGIEYNPARTKAKPVRARRLLVGEI